MEVAWHLNAWVNDMTFAYLMVTDEHFEALAAQVEIDAERLELANLNLHLLIEIYQSGALRDA